MKNRRVQILLVCVTLVVLICLLVFGCDSNGNIIVAPKGVGGRRFGRSSVEGQLLIFSLFALGFVAFLIYCFVAEKKLREERRQCWEANPNGTIVGYIDDVIVVHHRHRLRKKRGGHYGYVNSQTAYYVISFIDLKGHPQQELRIVGLTTQTKKIQENIGKKVIFEYADDGYIDYLPQLSLEKGIFCGKQYNNLVGIREDMSDMTAVITLPNGEQTLNAYKLYSTKYKGPPPEIGPSILSRTNCTLGSMPTKFDN